ncbi:MAG TPA: ABC transporter permease, partial [Trebonia sp.]
MATIEAPRAVRRRSALARLTITEAKLFLRDRVGPIWGIGFPMLLLIIFGSIPSFSKPQAAYGGLTVLDVYVPILILMMLALLSLVAMPLVLAGYREKGTLRRLRTTPAGPARVLAAQLIVNAATVVFTVVLILVVAGLAYSVPLPRQFGAWILAA